MVSCRKFQQGFGKVPSVVILSAKGTRNRVHSWCTLACKWDYFGENGKVLGYSKRVKNGVCKQGRLV